MIKRRQMEGIALAKERGAYTGRQRTVSDETLQKVKEMVEQGIPLAKAAEKKSHQPIHRLPLSHNPGKGKLNVTYCKRSQCGFMGRR